MPPAEPVPWAQAVGVVRTLHSLGAWVTGGARSASVNQHASGLHPARLRGSSSARLDPARLDPARLDPARLGPARLDPARLDPARLGPTRLGPTRLDAARLGPAPP